jgi:hypothetical protein
MQFGDIMRGIGMVLFIAVLAGAIAYVGDRVGHQVGRKRLTLFGIRPRYTSTIVAVTTGMVIALVVTLGAIIASQQVKTAFFRLNSINNEIERLQAQQTTLEKKVNTGHIVVNTGTLMSPTAILLFPNETPDARLKRIRQFYQSTVQFVNSTWVPPLRKFSPPPNVDKELEDASTSIKMQAMLTRAPVMVVAATDSNLYDHDPIHFNLEFFMDVPVFASGQEIAQLQIPAARNINAGIAANQLLARVASEANDHHMPPYFSANVRAERFYPSPQQIQQMLDKGQGEYLLTAYAAQDVYPHTGQVPVVVTLAKAP